MNKQLLQMKYHPAKKEVEFHRFQNGKELSIHNDSRLTHYMKMKGKFVLQDHGNAFFDDIANAFDGLKSIDIQVITTKIDYEDFEQMAEFYNDEPGECKIYPTLIAELPDMARTFTEVKKYGEQAIGVLQSHRQKLFTIPLENESVRQSAESFAKQIDEEVRNIRGKIDSLCDNHINLCFTGVFSAGKSALINAILGYKILPEAVSSETAKMFRISSPRKGEAVKIVFDILGVLSELEWNEKTQAFEFSKGPSESPVRTEIQKVMNHAAEEKKMRHEQIKGILSDLNARAEVSSEIKVLFPVSLDTESIQFTIFDTPGTDSNYQAHEAVLNEALAEQTHSILIFVAHPTKLEGEGNNALLHYLKAAEEKNSKTSIDISRSLFVINHSDTVTASDREGLKYKEIKNKDDESLTIKLADKKLFFTSARYAYAAKAVANGIATEEEKSFYKLGQMMLAEDASPMSNCYKQNSCATSECATKKMLEKCGRASAEARERNDTVGLLSVCSGMYALESEIVSYGEKYASAVKVYAILDSVDRALTKLNNRANSLHDSNQVEMHKIEESIAELRNTINGAIEEEYHKTAVPADGPLPEAARKRLKLDKEILNRTIVGHTKTRLDKELKRQFFGLGKVKVREKDKEKIRRLISGVIDEFTDSFLSERKTLLEEQRDHFMEAVKDTIMRNGRISDAAKRYFLDIPVPTVTKPDKEQDVESIYDAHRRMDKIWMFKVEHLDKEGFIREMEEKLTKLAGMMSDDYGRDYRNSLETLLTQITSQFKSNLAEYSLNMKAMIENKDAMKQLGDRISAAACALSECQKQLDAIIWKEVKNA